MLESIFILLFIIAVVLMIIAIFEKSVVFSMLSLIIFLVLMAGSLDIQIPYNVYNETANFTTEAFHRVQDFGVNALIFAFIIIDLIWAIICYMEFK